MTRSLRKTLGLLALLLLALVTARATMGAALAGPPMGRPDPKMMSGIPRVDPELPAGMITVRCLAGGFDTPAIGRTVTLELRAPDGATETRTTETIEQGRALFRELDAFVGGTAVASVDFDGEVVRSREIPLDARAGSRVMLVQGAGSSSGASAPATGADHGASGRVPMPGEPFSDARFDPGTVVVGTLDLAAGKPIAGLEVLLRGTTPDGQPIVLRKQSDADGRTRFEGLLAEHPQGTSWIAEATLTPAGGEPKLERSQPFTLEEDRGAAVVLAIGGRGEAAPAPEAAPQLARRRPVTPPHRLRNVPPGVVQVTVIDADDRPLEGVGVVVKREAVTGAAERVDGATGRDGIARVKITVSADSLYHVEVEHDGAPYETRSFVLDDRTGVGVELRVFAVTRDPSVVRGEVQFAFIAQEQDKVQVAQLTQVFVTGDKAFWPGEGFRLEGAPGASGFVVMNRASDVVAHREGDPYATLQQPIPPGEIVDLSVGYLLEHDGAVAFSWTAPLTMVAVSAVMDPSLEVTRGALGPPVQPPHDPQRDVVDLYKLGDLAPGQRVEIEVGNLPTNEFSRLLRLTGVVGAILLALATLVAVVHGVRQGARERLLERYRALLTALESVEAEGAVEVPGVERGGAARRPGAFMRRKLIVAALDRVYRELEEHGGAPAPDRRKKS
ncbi:MAG: hypothetical protein R3A51_08820 [Nannocystaceae bacterium]|nr:hypothetical protein [Myxococcales bacterium]